MVVLEHRTTDPPKEKSWDWRTMQFPAIVRRLFRIPQSTRFDAAGDVSFADFSLSTLLSSVSGRSPIARHQFILGYLPGSWQVSPNPKIAFFCHGWLWSP